MDARCSITIDASPREVFAVLLDPYAYPRWVMGARAIRAVDESWPEPNSSFHHRSGTGPVQVTDRTTLLEKSDDSFLRLRARAWPMGEAEVRLTLRPDGQRTVLTLEEIPSAGPAKVFGTPLLLPALHTRNVLSLRRLRDLVESR